MGLVSLGKKIAKNNKGLVSVLSPIHNLTGFNRKSIKGNNNKIIGFNKSFVSKCSIKIVGDNNVIEFGDLCYLKGCKFLILGNDNRINLSELFYGINTEFWIQDDSNSIEIGKGSSIGGTTHLAATEGKRIVIGKDCMLASDISIRTGDSHSIMTKSDGKRINPAEDVLIGDRVWIATSTKLLKGAIISDDSIVGTGALVTKKFTQPNSLIVGSPAKVVKEDVEWAKERI